MKTDTFDLLIASRNIIGPVRPLRRKRGEQQAGLGYDQSEALTIRASHCYHVAPPVVKKPDRSALNVTDNHLPSDFERASHFKMLSMG